MINFILVAIGGAIGAMCRYALSSALKCTGTFSGIGTFVVNIIGCFAIGLLCGWISHTVFSADFKNAANLLLVTGVCGGFTTYSTFALDAVKYFQSGNTIAALAYIFATLLLGVALCTLGLYLTTKP